MHHEFLAVSLVGLGRATANTNGINVLFNTVPGICDFSPGYDTRIQLDILADTNCCTSHMEAPRIISVPVLICVLNSRTLRCRLHIYCAVNITGKMPPPSSNR